MTRMKKPSGPAADGGEFHGREPTSFARPFDPWTDAIPGRENKCEAYRDRTFGMAMKLKVLMASAVLENVLSRHFRSFLQLAVLHFNAMGSSL